MTDKLFWVWSLFLICFRWRGECANDPHLFLPPLCCSILHRVIPHWQHVLFVPFFLGQFCSFGCPTHIQKKMHTFSSFSSLVVFFPVLGIPLLLYAFFFFFCGLMLGIFECVLLVSGEWGICVV
uniref:Secreted protein n=1 Tax=Ixodes ricinus TaxID=34613 RepID=A0A6B0UPF7_IXORI